MFREVTKLVCDRRANKWQNQQRTQIIGLSVYFFTNVFVNLDSSSPGQKWGNITEPGRKRIAVPKARAHPRPGTLDPCKEQLYLYRCAAGGPRTLPHLPLPRQRRPV